MIKVLSRNPHANRVPFCLACIPSIYGVGDFRTAKDWKRTKTNHFSCIINNFEMFRTPVDGMGIYYSELYIIRKHYWLSLVAKLPGMSLFRRFDDILVHWLRIECTENTSSTTGSREMGFAFRRVGLLNFNPLLTRSCARCTRGLVFVFRTHQDSLHPTV